MPAIFLTLKGGAIQPCGCSAFKTDTNQVNNPEPCDCTAHMALWLL